jgi:hypothetical protein
LWDKLPDVPVKVTVEVEAPAEDAADRIVLCAVPGVRVSEAGFAVIPEGSPVIAILTELVNPLDAVALMLIVAPVAPAVTVDAVGATDSVKSGAGAGAVIVAFTVAE